MHEMSICQSIRSAIEDHAARDSFTQVKRVRLEIGPLAGVETEALKFGFDVVMRGSMVEGATLEIIEPPATAWCLPCGESVPIAQRFDACPKCGSHQLQLTSGEELRIKELEVT